LLWLATRLALLARAVARHPAAPDFSTARRRKTVARVWPIAPPNC